MVKWFQTAAGLTLSGLFKPAVICPALVIMIAITGGAQAPVPAAPTAGSPAEVAPENTVAATATPAPTVTPLPSPTPTWTPTAEPSATPEPTATAIPPLAVLEDGGFDAWCAPVEYAGVIPDSPEAPSYARKLTLEGDQLQVQIPASSCVVSVRFNQPAPEDAQLIFYDANSPFLKLPLQPAGESSDIAWTAVNHQYVLDPPLWDVTYRLAVVSADGTELWTDSVKFAKALPEPCPYGGYPDPVTLWCAVTDPWEIEPWPDVVYPYDRSRFNKTPNP